jgi:hypothetical protein
MKNTMDDTQTHSEYRDLISPLTNNTKAETDKGDLMMLFDTIEHRKQTLVG